MALVRLALLAALAGAAGFVAGFLLRRLLPRLWRAPAALMGFLAAPVGAQALAAFSDKGEEMSGILDLFFAALIGVPAGVGWALAIMGAFQTRT